MANFKKKNLVLSIFILLLFLDVLFLLLHYLFGQRLEILHLDVERNIPTVYQGMKLVIIACLVSAYIIVPCFFGDKNSNKKLFWTMAPLVFLFGFLALDEVGQLHESIYPTIAILFPNFMLRYESFLFSLGYSSSFWLVLYFPFIILALGYFTYLAWYIYEKGKKHFFIFFLSITFFVLALFMEFIGTKESLFQKTSLYFDLIVPAEEFLEMLGGTFFMFFFMTLLQDSLFMVRGGINRKT